MTKGISVVTLLSLAFALAAADVSPASASKSRRAQVQALQAKTKRLERRAARQEQELTRVRKELGARSAEVETLQQQLAGRTSERDVARAESAELHRQLVSKPSLLEQAVEQVRREVAYVELYRLSRPREELIARSAMDYVVGHVTAPGYGYMNRILGTQPLPTAESALEFGSGICGNAALTFAAILKRFGLPVRSVQFYYANGVDNHIAVEVFYDGGWHYFDPTWAAYYEEGGRVLSIGEARARANPRALLNHHSTLFWRWVGTMAGVEPLGAETDASTRVDIDKQPFPDS